MNADTATGLLAQQWCADAISKNVHINAHAALLGLNNFKMKRVQQKQVAEKVLSPVEKPGKGGPGRLR